jgi:hypothetical protein
MSLTTSASLIVFLVFAQAFCSETPIEVRHGTIIAWEWDGTPTRIIIVADSKLFPSATGKTENACKIVNLSNDIIFFYTGNLFDILSARTGKPIFSQQDLARQAADPLTAQPRSYAQLRNVANKYSELVRPKMDELLKILSEPSTRIGLAGFASLDESKHPRLVLVNIPITIPNNGAPAYTGVPDISEWPNDAQHSMGTGYYPPNMGVFEFLDVKTDRAKRAMANFEARIPKLPKRDVEVYRLIGAVEAALSWNQADPTVGPPVDAVIVESGTGVRWVRRKPSCRAPLT